MFENARLKLNGYILSALDQLFMFALKERLGEKSRQFIGNFGWLFWGEIVGSLIGFPVKIMAGRFLGPVEYGKYSLVLSLSQFFIIPMIFGLTSGIQKYLSEQKEKIREILNFVLPIFIVTTIISVLLFVFIKTPLIRLLELSPDVYFWTIVFSVIISFFYIFEAIIRSLNKYRLVFWSIIVGTIVNLAVFSVLIFSFDLRIFWSLVVSNLASYVVSIVIFISARTHYPRSLVSPEKHLLYRKIINYSALGVVGAITGFFISQTDRFMLNGFLSLSAVGIYAAYQNASNVFVGRFFQLFLNVYFPSISAEPDKEKIKKLLKKLWKIALPAVFFLSFLTIWPIIALFGKEFPIDFRLISLFSISNCLFVFYQLYMWLLNSEGPPGMRATLRILIVGSFLNLAVLYLLVRPFGLLGAIASAILINLIFSVYFWQKVNKFFKTIK